MLKYSPTTDDGRSRLGYFYIFISDYKNDPPPHLPRDQLVVPTTKQEINEPSQEMVGVKISMATYGQLQIFVIVIVLKSIY